jgi:L-ascorbate metabolism protein UlaG (beta-lactamase superfamily)
VNHATVLVQLDGMNILTDPIWSDRCSPVQWAGPKRHHAPGLRFEDLPPLDLVLISHNHYDHLDLNTLTRIAQDHDPLVLVGLGNGPLVQRLGLRVQELDWDQATQAGPLSVIGQRSRHFSSRGLFDRMATLWLGFAIVGPSGTVYFGGDTGMGSHFAETGERYGPIDLAFIPIGAYQPRWFMGPVHLDPQDAVRAHQALRSRHSVGIHHGTFQLTQEGQDDPIRELMASLEDANLPPQSFQAIAPGETLFLPPEEGL